MKVLLLALSFVGPMLAFAQDIPMTEFPVYTAEPPPADLPEMTWVFRPYIRAGAVLSVAQAQDVLQQTQSTFNKLTDLDNLDQMVVNIGQNITKLSQMNEEEAAVEIINDLFGLSEMAQGLAKSKINAGTAFSFVAFPSPKASVDDLLALDDFSAFSQHVLAGMTVAQKWQKAKPENQRDWYFLGAVGNIKVESHPNEVPNGDMHLQLVLGLRPRIIKQGENTIEIPQVERAEDTPVAIVDINMPMAVSLPEIEITFGKLGELQPTKSERLSVNGRTVSKSDWRLRFAVDAGSLCSRTSAVPQIYKKISYGPTLVIPMYHVFINGNEQQLTSVDARLAGIYYASPLCTQVFGQVPKQVLSTVNESIQTAMNDDGFFSLFRLSLRELAARVQQRQTQPAGQTQP